MIMDTAQKASDYAQKTAGKVASASAQTAEMLGEKGEQLLDVQRKMVKQSRSYVIDHPVAALGIAAAIGYALNYLLSER
jgi:ElaB/YqjD/DUF883 family membrane-anchored ribosome-binding protein